MRSCYVFDIDGTIADCEHRLHHIQKHPKDWGAFFAACEEDEPIKPIIEIANALHHAGNDIVLVSGRSDSVKASTEEWLDKHYVPYAALYMRPAKDHKDDDKLKIEMLEQLRADGWEPVMVFDDRSRVVNAWRAAGIPCAQVAAGDF